MSIRLTDEQRALRDAVRELADERIAPRAAEIDATAEFPWDVVKLLAEHDVLALPFPLAHGGLGADLLTTCLAVEQIARVCATSSLILAVQALGSLPLLLAGNDEQHARWFPDLAAGRMLAAFALTEPEAGSDAAALRTRAVREGSGDADAWRIDGNKRFITHGSVAGLVTVFAQTDTDPAAVKAHRHLTCFAVEQGTPGFSAGKLEHKMGIRGSPTAELLFDGVRVPDSQRVGAVGEGWAIAMGTLDRSRPGVAAQAVGLAQGATEVATRYAGERRQFGRPIGEFELIQGLLADMAARTEAARQLLYAACEEVESGSPRAARWSAMCKLVAGDTAMAVTTDAVQVLGGYGYIADYPVERMMRDAKITQLYEGTQQIQRLVVARDLLAHGA
ncbi:MAG TPA: acyl-CoA dehydrogenase family protein [Candidatus Limnocylindrales bacterium]|nr:acyl-CoA dehydrogenase family protein [Candidatus Limnocylindrales bacterium]